MNLTLGISEIGYSLIAEPRKPKNVQILPEPPNDSLNVRWSAPRCDMSTAQNAYVHSYKIGYCQSDEQGICKHTGRKLLFVARFIL